MASPAWLPQEVQPSTSQASGSSPPAGGQSTTPSTPTATPPSAVGTPTLKDASGTAGDPTQETAPTNFANAPGYATSQPSFSYIMPPNVNTTSRSSQQSSSSTVVNSNSPGSSAFLKPPVPGLSASSGPSFSYNISHADIAFPGGQQFQSRMLLAPGHSQGVKNISSSAAFLQPPVPGQLARPSSFVPGTTAQIMPLPLPVAVPKGASSNAANFSYNGNPQSVQKDQSLKCNATDHVTQGSSTVSSALSVSQSVSQPVHATSSAATSTSNMASSTFWMSSAPSFQVRPAVDSSSSARLGSMIPTTHVQSNPALQQQMYASYASNPRMVVPPQGLWLQPPQISGLPRPPLLAYPATFPGSFPLPTHGMPLLSVPMPDSQPPGVTAIGVPGVTSVSSAASDNQSSIGSGMQPEFPPGIDNSKHANDLSVKVESAPIEQLDAWSAHMTETGAVYYYNALTGESTYQKPSGFKGEPDKVIAQPTPISWEKCAGTDWSLVTTNDGKRYYYNAKTKLSSWQIPNEVTELRKRQDGDALKEQTMSVPNSNMLTEKGFAPLSLSAPAVNTGGRDATALRTSGVPGSSSALDLIKKKLQESGAPATSPVPALSGAVPSEVNGSSAVEIAKGLHSENGKDKLKDPNTDGNLSDTSSDSDIVDSRPTKEECSIQFKEMLKERGVAPFSKWEKELPKIVFDPRFKAIPGYSARRALFEHYVRTRAEEERKEKRAAQKAAIEGYKQLLEEAKEDINQNTDYQIFKRKWGHDPRFEALERKEREVLLNERVLPLKRSAEEEARAIRAAAISSFKSMLRDKGDVSTSSRWSKVKDTLRNDPRYKSVKHEDREALFNEYISELKSAEEEAERVAKAKRDEEEKLKERERALRKRKEREEHEVERVRSKARRKEAIESYQALLVETIKDPQVSWTDSKPKLEKDPQGRAANPYLDQSDVEKLFREHVKILHERSAHEFRALLAEVITAETAVVEKKEDGKTAVTSWSTAKRLLKIDPRYTKISRKERESLWRRHVEDMRRQKLVVDQESEKLAAEVSRGGRSSVDSGKYHLSWSRTRRTRHDHRR